MTGKQSIVEAAHSVPMRMVQISRLQSDTAGFRRVTLTDKQSTVGSGYSVAVRVVQISKLQGDKQGSNT